MTANNKHKSQERRARSKPIQQEEDVARNPDPKIDEDFKGFPHAPAREDIIRPENPTEHLTAGTQLADKNEETEQQESDGSARGFEKTEHQPTNTKKGRANIIID